MTTIKKYIKKDGKTYYWFKYYVGIDPNTNKKKYLTRRGFPSIKEAKKKFTSTSN